MTKVAIESPNALGKIPVIVISTVAPASREDISAGVKTPSKILIRLTEPGPSSLLDPGSSMKK